MLFYKVNTLIMDEKWVTENKDRSLKGERIEFINSKTEDYNKHNGNDPYCFVSNIDGNKLICGIISSAPCDAGKTALSFTDAINVKIKSVKSDETTFSSINNLMEIAERYDYINDKDDILELFDLYRINSRYCCNTEYGENLVDEHKEKKTLYDAADRLLSGDSLCPELDRIYSGSSNAKAYGHPVHYFIETDHKDTRNKLERILLQALYDNGRLKSRRYCFIDIKPAQNISRFLFDTIYRSCIGGTIAVRYLANDDSDDDEYANGELDIVSLLCEAALRYRNKVLTVLCLPRNCERIKSTFFEYLGDVSIIEIKEDLADAERSCKYLRMLCRGQQIRPDKNLLNKIEVDKKYLPEELRKIFDEWYNVKMKTSVFPQYKDVEVCRKTMVKKEERGFAFDDLKKMVGLREAKDVIGKALNYYRLQRIYKDKGIKQDRPAMHMVFTGNPGTAKTTVARLFARIMKENGLLSKGHLVEVGRGDLVGKYVGWTAQIVMEKFKQATGGVLFIDEAYSLVEDRDGMYGDEAINTIVQEMENRREDLVVIFAGYPDEMERFLNKNPGLRSRIAFHVPFADYDSDELCDIAKMIGKSKGITLTEAAVAKLAEVFDAARRQTGFGNGRYVRNVIELSKMNQASRILSMNPDEVTEETLTSIDDVDIEIPVINREPAKRMIGFAS